MAEDIQKNSVTAIVNTAQILKAFNDTVKQIESIDSKKVKIALGNLHDFSGYIDDFFKTTADISKIIESRAADVSVNVIKGQEEIIKLVGQSLDIITKIADIKFPNLIQLTYKLWEFKHRFYLILNTFFKEGGIVTYLENLNKEKEITVVDEYTGKATTQKVTRVKNIKTVVDDFENIIDTIKGIIDNVAEMSAEIIKKSLIIYLGLRVLLKGYRGKGGILDKLYTVLSSEELKRIGDDKISDLLDSVEIVIDKLKTIVNIMIDIADIENIGRLHLLSSYVIPMVNATIFSIERIGKTESGQPIVITPKTALFKNTTAILERLKILIAEMTVFNIGVAAIVILSNKIAPIVLSEINKFFRIISEKTAELARTVSRVTDVSKTIRAAKKFLDAILLILKDILILALASGVLIFAVPMAIFSITMVSLFIKIAVREMQWIIGGKNFNKLITSSEKLAILVTIIVLTMLVATLGIIAIAMLGKTLLKVILPALATFMIVALVVLAMAWLATIIDNILRGRVAMQVYRGLLIILAMIGTILIVGTALLLLALIGALLCKYIKLIIVTFLIITVVVGLIALFGLAVSLLAPYLAAAAIGVVLVTIAVTAITLIAVQLLLLSLIGGLLIAKKQVILDAVDVVMATAMEVIRETFKGINYKPNNQTKGTVIGRFFRSLVGGAAMVIEALMSSAILVFTFVSVTMILLIALELLLLTKIHLDPNVVHKKVSDIMNAAHTCINAIFGDAKQPATQGEPRFLPALKHFFVGLVDILDLIVAIAKLALIMVSIGFILLIAMELKAIGKVELDSAAISDKVRSIFDCADECIKAVFQDSSKQPSENKGWLRGALMRFFKNSVDFVQTVLAIGRIAVTLVAIGLIYMIAEKLKKIQDIELDSVAINVKVRQIMNVSQYLVDCVNSDRFIVKRPERKLNNFDYIIKLLKKTEHSAEIISRIGANNSTNGFNNVITNYIKFIDKINGADLNKLQLTTKLFAEIAKFSESINGNFEGLAEALNEKIMPLLEELKNILTGTADAAEDVKENAEGISTGGGSTRTNSNGIKQVGEIKNNEKSSKNYVAILTSLQNEISNIQDIMTNGSMVTRML